MLLNLVCVKHNWKSDNFAIAYHPWIYGCDFFLTADEYNFWVAGCLIALALCKTQSIHHYSVKPCPKRPFYRQHWNTLLSIGGDNKARFPYKSWDEVSGPYKKLSHLSAMTNERDAESRHHWNSRFATPSFQASSFMYAADSFGISLLSWCRYWWT